jgi:hypothetical protein
VAVAAGLVVVLTAIAVGYIRWAAGRTAQDRPSAGAIDLAVPGWIAFRSRAPGSDGRLALVPVSDPSGPRRLTALSCNRFAAGGGVGLCLRPDGPLATFQVAEVDRQLAVRREIPLVGVPNRARVSPDGRFLAWTVFVQGDSYNGGLFSTRAGILDRRTSDIRDLEEYAISVDGQPYHSIDVNFWGVTFTGHGGQFYATMSTRGRRYLVAGDALTATVHTIQSNVECPALSPDGRRLAFKEAVGGDPARGWRLTVLDLATGRRTHLAETRSVDDQAIWLDDRTVAYSRPRGAGADVWAVPADGSGAARLLIPDAESPAVL